MKRIILFMLVSFAPVYALFPRQERTSRPPLTITSAILDTALTDDIRDAFQDDDGRPLKSIAVDLDGDGKPEKLIPNEFLGGSGGCPWLIFDPRTRRVLGEIDAKEFYVLTQKNNGYHSLECSWSLGSDRMTMTRYDFDGRKYVKR